MNHYLETLSAKLVADKKIWLRVPFFEPTSDHSPIRLPYETLTTVANLLTRELKPLYPRR